MQSLDHTQSTQKETTQIGEWWNSLDKPILTIYFALLILGIALIGTASPPVAERIGFSSYNFFKKQILFAFLSIVPIVILSTMTPKYLRLSALALLIISTLAIMLSLLVGAEIKGAQRWLFIFGFSVQPSEFMKPGFAVVCAWLISTQRNNTNLPQSALSSATGYYVAIGLTGFIAALLLLQPDLGQTLLVLITAFSLALMVGVPLMWCLGLMALGVFILLSCYYFLPHVKLRFDGYFSDGGGNYQVQQSLQAFGSGGFFGKGPSEGTVKHDLPDSHTDFIFAVTAEEFGFIGGAFILSLLIYLFFHIVRIVTKENNHFIILTCVALTVQLAAQAFINMASSLNLTPTTGMTLPLISYGGSSLLAVSITFGLLIGFTRKRNTLP